MNETSQFSKLAYTSTISKLKLIIDNYYFKGGFFHWKKPMVAIANFEFVNGQVYHWSNTPNCLAVMIAGSVHLKIVIKIDADFKQRRYKHHLVLFVSFTRGQCLLLMIAETGWSDEFASQQQFNGIKSGIISVVPTFYLT